MSERTLEEHIGDLLERDKASYRKVRTLSWFIYGNPHGWRNRKQSAPTVFERLRSWRWGYV
jgi:hypothetical protein